MSALQRKLSALLLGAKLDGLAVEEDATGDPRLLFLHLDALRTIEIGGEDRDGNLVLTLLTKENHPAWTDADDPTTELTTLLRNKTVDYITVDAGTGVMTFTFKGDGAPGLTLQFLHVNKLITRREPL